MVFTGFDRADAIASLVVVALMLKAGMGLLRDSVRILLEAAPAGLDPDDIGDALAASTGVAEVHDLHVWTITSGQPALSAHVLVQPNLDCHQARLDLEAVLRQRYRLTHTTLQVDHIGDDLLQIGTDGRSLHCDDAHGPTHTGEDHPH
jgi:cobalt-zinc-cadmium efflux system protein